MSLRKGLIGLFVLFFLLSGVGMIILVQDDRKDLSSRASIGVPTQKRGPLQDVNFVQNIATWSGQPLSLPVEISYDPAVWQPPVGKDSVFLGRLNTVTVRVIQSVPNEASLKNILGPNFVFISKGSIENSYIFNFFGEQKNVIVWPISPQIALLSVSQVGSSTVDIVNLVAEAKIISNPSKVKGLSTNQDDSSRLAALVRPSVVLILTSYCANVKLADIPGTTLSGKQYPLCLSATGTGFFITPDGNIATNGHVTILGDNTTIISAVTLGQLDDLLVDFTQEYIRQTTGQEVQRELIVQKVKDAKQNKESIYQLAGSILKLKESNLLTLQNEKYNYYVQIGNTPITISKNSGVNLGPDILSGTRVDYDYKEVDPTLGFSSSDVAIIKVEGKNFPALPLGDFSDVSIGNSIQVIGFPGVAGGTGSLLLDTSANTEPTVTKGVVSALKKAKGNQKNLIQTDASITHGNSGGPAVNSEGKVIGIATYGLIPEEGSGNYNFLRDINDLKDLMKKNNIVSSTGDTYNSWKSGLDNFWLSYYRYANSDFTKVEKLYPSHPTVKKYLEETQKLMGTNSDLTPLFTRSQRRIYMAVSGITMVVSLIAVMILFVLEKISRPPKQILLTTPQAPTNNLSGPPIQTF